MARVRIPLTRTKASNMPPACIICGSAVDGHVPHTFAWRPAILSTGFWISLFLCTPLAVVILVVGFTSTLRVSIDCPVCERHRGYWARRGFWLSAPLLAVTAVALVVGVLIVLRQVDDDAFGYLFVGTLLALVAWGALAAVLQGSGVQVEQITADDIVLTGVDSTFADLLRGERPRRDAEPDYGWEDYDPYPRRPALP